MAVLWPDDSRTHRDEVYKERTGKAHQGKLSVPRSRAALVSYSDVDGSALSKSPVSSVWSVQAAGQASLCTAVGRGRLASFLTASCRPHLKGGADAIMWAYIGDNITYHVKYLRVGTSWPPLVLTAVVALTVRVTLRTKAQPLPADTLFS